MPCRLQGIFILRVSFSVMYRIAPFAVADRIAGHMDPGFQAAFALLRLFVEAGFVFIEQVILAVFNRREVGHDHVCTHHQRLFTALRVDGLHGRGGSDVDVFHHDAQDGHHFKRQVEPFFEGEATHPCI